MSSRSTTGTTRYETTTEVKKNSIMQQLQIILSKRINVMAFIYFFCFTMISFSQVELDYYLPEISYDTEMPTPEDILGYQIGEWHLSHDQLVSTLKTLCENSDKCIYQEYGRTHENRPLVNLVISSEKNLNKLDQLVSKHSQLTYPNISNKVNKDDTPIIIYQGYSVHGNESSGANASPLIAYYLLAGRSSMLDNLLDEAIIVLDPCYNPDGLQRFSTWANSHKHTYPTTDPNSREFNEVWPGGRTNHYWFDLNRDWLFTIHPSSQARIENFHKWKPDILTDHHEMGSNSTFFFQPGVPSRTNPNTPPINQALTEDIGAYHAASLDSIGSLYYTKESFDDFYYGKGSTYPDINGCIGILFEQASARGHLRETKNGLLSFPFTIRNQFVTALSTQKAALEMKETLLDFKKDYYKQRYDEASTGFYIFEEDDYYKKRYFIDLLHRHEIDVYRNEKDISIDGKTFSTKDSYIVPKKQRQTTVVKTIFEKVHEFKDSIFYDVSAWTIPLALNMKYGESDKKVKINEDLKLVELPRFKNNNDIDQNAYAIALDWSCYLSPSLLYDLQSKDIKVRVIRQETNFKENNRAVTLTAGDVIIPLSNQAMNKTELIDYILNESNERFINIRVLDSGFNTDGKSIGSPSQSILPQPEVAMIVGEGINAYEAGDTWYQLDYRYRMPITMIDKTDVPFADLSRYNMIILPDGNYSTDDNVHNKIKEWTKDGGTLLAMRKAISYLSKTDMLKLTVKKEKNISVADSTHTKFRNYRGSQVIGGAIVESEVDLDHPLFYGYENNILPVFKKGTQFYMYSDETASPMKYSSVPLLSGYASKSNQDKASNAMGILCSKYGKGKIISMVDNPNFRGYWLGGSRLFANAIFFNSLIDRDSLAE